MEIVQTIDKEDIVVGGSQAAVVLLNAGGTIGTYVVDCAQALELTQTQQLKMVSSF